MLYQVLVNTLTGGLHLNLDDKRDDFTFELVDFPFLEGEVLRSPSLVYVFRNLFVLESMF